MRTVLPKAKRHDRDVAAKPSRPAGAMPASVAVHRLEFGDNANLARACFDVLAACIELGLPRAAGSIAIGGMTSRPRAPRPTSRGHRPQFGTSRRQAGYPTVEAAACLSPA